MFGPTASVHGPVGSQGALQPDEVHLWWGRVGQVETLDAAWGWLSDEERRRGERFRHARDAHAFLFRRAFLRAVLARHVGCGPEELVFVGGPFGKPALAPPHAELGFNATSRDGLALVGVTRGGELGVDLEACPSALVADPEEIARLVRRVATARERARLLALPLEQRARGFLRLWTRKEAYLKALGTGLSREPGTVEVGWGAEDGPAEVRWLDVCAPDGFLAAAVVCP